MLRIALLLLVALMLFGCGAKVIPQQVAGGIIDLSSGSQTIDHHGVVITVQLDDLQYAPYRQVDNIASFQVGVNNNSMHPWAFPFELVRLVAADGQQFSAVSPLRVKEMVSRDLPYMVPYPYVGYYYLEDVQRGSHFNSFTSDLPYYAANHPQDIFTQALPEVAVEPGNRISGLLYFVCNLDSMSSFEFKVNVPASGNYPGAEYVFPFTVEK